MALKKSVEQRGKVNGRFKGMQLHVSDLNVSYDMTQLVVPTQNGRCSSHPRGSDFNTEIAGRLVLENFLKDGMWLRFIQEACSNPPCGLFRLVDRTKAHDREHVLFIGITPENVESFNEFLADHEDNNNNNNNNNNKDDDDDNNDDDNDDEKEVDPVSLSYESHPSSIVLSPRLDGPPGNGTMPRGGSLPCKRGETTASDRKFEAALTLEKIEDKDKDKSLERIDVELVWYQGGIVPPAPGASLERSDVVHE
ncbi:hypothetical protein V1477_018666 [Vespula maculifrons]|uniref:Uncharacterized protein n=1 Tax=Vespula maculifrons TaxID=7453 RepID=A0ABD2AYL3_VESMC